MNVWEVMQQELANFYQLLYHVTTFIIFQVKSWSDSTLCCFVHCVLVSTLLKNNPDFYLVIIQRFLNFPPILRIRSAERILVVMYFWTLVSALNLMLAFLVIFDRCFAKLSLLSVVAPSTFSCLLFLRVSFPHTRLVWSSLSTPNNIKKHLSGLRTMKLL